MSKCYSVNLGDKLKPGSVWSALTNELGEYQLFFSVKGKISKFSFGSRRAGCRAELGPPLALTSTLSHHRSPAATAISHHNLPALPAQLSKMASQGASAKRQQGKPYLSPATKGAPMGAQLTNPHPRSPSPVFKLQEYAAADCAKNRRRRTGSRRAQVSVAACSRSPDVLDWVESGRNFGFWVRLSRSLASPPPRTFFSFLHRVALTASQYLPVHRSSPIPADSFLKHWARFRRTASASA